MEREQTKTETCPTCKGSGRIVNNNSTAAVKCTKCGGSGEVRQKRPRIQITKLPLFKSMGKGNQ